MSVVHKISSMTLIKNWYFSKKKKEENTECLTHCQPVYSAHNLFKQMESNLFDTQMVFFKEFFEKVDFEKNQQMTKKFDKYPREQRVTTNDLTHETLFEMVLLSTRNICFGLSTCRGLQVFK